MNYWMTPTPASQKSRRNRGACERNDPGYTFSLYSSGKIHTIHIYVVPHREGRVSRHPSLYGIHYAHMVCHTGRGVCVCYQGARDGRYNGAVQVILPIQHCIFTPELQWQSRGQMPCLTGVLHHPFNTACWPLNYSGNPGVNRQC
jgi:hypothetical protein